MGNLPVGVAGIDASGMIANEQHRVTVLLVARTVGSAAHNEDRALLARDALQLIINNAAAEPSLSPHINYRCSRRYLSAVELLTV